MKELLLSAKRILLMLLCVMLVVANVPALAFAEEAAGEQPAADAVETPPVVEATPEPVLEDGTANEEPQTQEPLPGNWVEYFVPQDYSLYNIVNRSYKGAPIYIGQALSLLQAELSEAMNVISSSIDGVNINDVYVIYNHDRELAYDRAAVQVAVAFCALENLAEADLVANKLLSVEQVNLLRSIYWDMVELAPICRVETVYSYAADGCTVVQNKIYHMEIDASFCSAAEYLLEPSMAQKLILDSLLAEPALSTMQSLCSGSYERMDYIAAAVINALPANLDSTRRKVVESACSLVGKVPYFWGGKSEVLGWDDSWNVPKVILSEGTNQVGDVMPFGLDCAGLISWAFINGAETQNAIAEIGHGVESQYYNSVLSSADAVQPGDLVFGYGSYGGYGHVGIVVGRNETGELLVCHCNNDGDGKVRIEPVSRTTLTMPAVPEKFYNAY